MMHERFMARALELSKLATNKVQSNPRVGCVVVHNEQIIAEGYHKTFGGDHAEVNALKNATASCKGATLYVTLEPCSFTGKTPPCVDAIIAAGIAHVVVGVPDPNPFVSGNGIQTLREAGIEVTTGILEQECLWNIRHFAHFITNKAPFTTVKIAQSLDGYIATATHRSQWISGEVSRTKAHELRALHTAIMVGVGTVLADDPMLTVRHVDGENPHRVIIDAKCRIATTSKIAKSSDAIPTSIYCLPEYSASKRAEELRSCGIRVTGISGDKDHVYLPGVMADLYTQGISSILCEGGGGIISALHHKGLIHELHTFTAPVLFGGGVQWLLASSDDPSESTRMKLHSLEQLENDVYAIYVR